MKSEQPDFLIMTDPYAEARAAAKPMDFSAGSKKGDRVSAGDQTTFAREAQPLFVVDVQTLFEKLAK
jgi:hypothetical protein